MSRFNDLMWGSGGAIPVYCREQSCVSNRTWEMARRILLDNRLPCGYSYIQKEGSNSLANDRPGNDRMIHIRVSPEIHKLLRLKAAQNETTMQDIVVDVLAKELLKGSKR